jgi:phospholipid/cholesterol/gamma-HCH transport system permease protein
MATDAAEPIGLHSPLERLGRSTLSAIGYLGRAGLLLESAARSFLPPKGARPAFGPALMWQLARLFGMGLPLVGLVHVGLGSFLAMQAYFGGTFIDGAGAVVGVGLVRNLAPLMSGMILAGLLAGRLTPELRGMSPRPQGEGAGPAPDPGRLTAVRVAAAVIAGPIFGLWGSAAGGLVGWMVASSLLGVTTHNFMQMFTEMLWVRDVVGLVVKGMAFGLFGALFACHEGLREGEPDATPTAAVRAACMAALAIMAVNSSWFILVYRAGPAFGPTLLAPPVP